MWVAVQAKLRVTKKQRDILMEQTRTALRQVAELRAERSRLAMQLQVSSLPTDAYLVWHSPTRCGSLCSGKYCGCMLLVCTDACMVPS